MMPYGPGDSPHAGMMPPIPPAQNFYENFYQQQEGMEMEPGLLGDAGTWGHSHLAQQNVPGNTTVPVPGGSDAPI